MWMKGTPRLVKRPGVSQQKKGSEASFCKFMSCLEGWFNPFVLIINDIHENQSTVLPILRDNSQCLTVFSPCVVDKIWPIDHPNEFPVSLLVNSEVFRVVPLCLALCQTGRIGLARFQGLLQPWKCGGSKGMKVLNQSLQILCKSLLLYVSCFIITSHYLSLSVIIYHYRFIIMFHSSSSSSSSSSSPFLVFMFHTFIVCS